MKISYQLTIFHVMGIQVFGIFHDLSSKNEAKVFNWSVGEFKRNSLLKLL